MSVSFSETIYRRLKQSPFAGLTSGELVGEFGVKSKKVYMALFRLKGRNLIWRDSETRRWLITCAAEAKFRASFHDENVAAQPGRITDRPEPLPLSPEPGTTADDLVWMRDIRDRSTARRQARAAMR